MEASHQILVGPKIGSKDRDPKWQVGEAPKSGLLRKQTRLRGPVPRVIVFDSSFSYLAYSILKKKKYLAYSDSDSLSPLQKPPPHGVIYRGW